MSKKWTHLFRRKNNTKADSHGTTAADEELQFQPMFNHHKEPARLSAKQPAAKTFPHGPNGLEDKFRDGVQIKEKRRNPESVALYNTDNHNNAEEKNQRGIVQEENAHFDACNQHLGAHIMKPPAGRGIPGGKDVNICDEYCDPLDMLKHINGSVQQSADGYREPYSLEQVADKGLLRQQNMKSPGNYHDPWDSTNGHHGSHGKPEYEDPWNSNLDATLVKSIQTSMSGHPRSARKQENLLMSESQSSATSSSSASPKPAIRGLVHTNQSKPMPKTTSEFDGRLILSKDASTNYCEPWTHQNRNKHFDNRLVKAEPSLEELKMISTVCSRSTNSTNSSGRATPSDSSPYMQKHLILDQSAIPQSQFPHLVHPNWAKSKSLDMHKGGCNTMVMSYSKDPSFRRSMSDDNLISATTPHIASTSTSNPQLSGKDIYEEPWDRSSSASRVHHSKNALFMIEGTGDSMDDDPFVTNAMTTRVRRENKNPSDHLQSMQRFQQRKLELHPSEAINARDIDPLLPLHSQAWYHGDISREQAEFKLDGHTTGSFLVRKSKSSKGGYSLSVQSSKGCVHILLKCTRDDNWILGEFSAPFLSASEMVAHYRRHQLRISDTESLVLSNPIESCLL